MSTSLPVSSVPDFLISQDLLPTSQQDSLSSLHAGSFVNKARMTWDRVLAASFSSGAPLQLYPSGPMRAMGSPLFPRTIVEFSVINANQKVDKALFASFAKLHWVRLGHLFWCSVQSTTLSVSISDYLRARFQADFFWEFPIDAFNFNL